jgi:hypothetical protein
MGGEVVGLATYGYSQKYTEGLYFALESNRAKKLYDVMKQVKSAIPDAGLPDCRIGKGSFRRPHSTYGFENFKKGLWIEKPSQLSIFYSEANSKIMFNSISLDMENKIFQQYEICFRFKVLTDGIILFNKIVSDQMQIDQPQTWAAVPVKIDFSTDYTPAWYYYELTAFDCETKDTYYRFYRRDFFDSQSATGDSDIFDKC